MSTINWQDISTAPKIDGQTYLGYDASAEEWGTPEDCLCLITWFEAEPDEGMPAGWSVQSLLDCLDEILDDRTRITLWAPVSDLVPLSARAA